MNIGVVLIIVGLIAGVAAYGLKAMFVNTADKENPYRKLVAVVGYSGLIAIGWGVVLLSLNDS